MILSKEDLASYIESDNSIYRPWKRKQKFIAAFAQYPTYALQKYLYYLRKQEFYINTANGSRIKGALAIFYDRKTNRLGYQWGFEKWQLMYMDAYYEAYEDSCKVLGPYLVRDKALFWTDYFDPHIIKKAIKGFLQRAK